MSIISDQVQISECNHADRFWQRANKVQTLIHGSLPTSVKFTCIVNKFLNFSLSDITNYRRHYNLDQRVYTHGYTNHGNCNFLNREETGIKIGGVVSGVSKLHVAGIMYHFITTVDHILIWNVCYTNNSTDRNTMTRYIRRCVEILTTSCGIE